HHGHRRAGQAEAAWFPRGVRTHCGRGHRRLPAGGARRGGGGGGAGARGGLMGGRLAGGGGYRTAPVGAVRAYAQGVYLLGRGMARYARTPKLMVLGLIPVAVTALLFAV